MWTRGAVPAASSTLGFLTSISLVPRPFWEGETSDVDGRQLLRRSWRDTELPKKQSKDEKSLKRLHVSPENERFPPRMHVRSAGLSNPPTYYAVGTSNF